MQDNCRRTCYNYALDVFRSLKSLSSQPHLSYYFTVCGDPDAHCDTEQASAAVDLGLCVDRELADNCAAWMEAYGCNTPSPAQLQQSGIIEPGRVQIHRLAPLTTPTAAAIIFSITGEGSVDRDAYALMAVWHFTNRRGSQYARAVTNDEGEYELEFLTPQPSGSKLAALQHLTVLPFASQEVEGAMVRHTFSSSQVQGNSGPSRDGKYAPIVVTFFASSDLTHLRSKTINMIDTATFSIAGKITRNGQTMLKDGATCFKEGVDVCIFELPADGNPLHVDRNNPLDCIKSDGAGRFVLNAVIDSSVVLLSKSTNEMYTIVADAKLDASSKTATVTADGNGWVITKL